MIDKEALLDFLCKDIDYMKKNDETWRGVKKEQLDFGIATAEEYIKYITLGNFDVKEPKDA